MQNKRDLLVPATLHGFEDAKSSLVVYRLGYSPLKAESRVRFPAREFTLL